MINNVQINVEIQQNLLYKMQITIHFVKIIVILSGKYKMVKMYALSDIVNAIIMKIKHSWYQTLINA